MPRKSNMNNYQRIPVQQEEALDTLGNGTGLVEALTGSFTTPIRITSVDAVWSLRNVTGGEGPIVFGVAHGDYSLAEIEAWIELTLGSITGPGDMQDREVANRLIRRIGAFSAATTDETINDGKSLKTRLNWLIPDGKTLQMWTYNASGATLTTGAIVRCSGHLNGFWQ